MKALFLGLEPGAAGWKTHTNPLSYGGTPTRKSLCGMFLYLFVQIADLVQLQLDAANGSLADVGSRYYYPSICRGFEGKREALTLAIKC